MPDCRHLIAEDRSAHGHSDIFDHPEYDYKCRLTGRSPIPCIHCNPQRCSNFEPTKEGEQT